ncbi:MAG: hypothetical protein IT220_04860 [Flavobacteriaceae bacterium]|nr:hypothetical protein [Flavobacteriaceae bacterium]
MKKYNLILIFLIFYTNVFSQENDFKIDSLLNYANTKQNISNLFYSYKYNLLKNQSSIFKEKNVKENIRNIKEYQEKLDTSTVFYIDYTYNVFKNDLKSKRYEIVNNFFDNLKPGINVNENLKSIKYTQYFDSLMNYHFEWYIHDLSLFIDEIKTNDEPLKLYVILENDTLQNFENIDLFLYTKNVKYSKINILNKKEKIIELPIDLKNSEIDSLVFNFNRYEILISDRKNRKNDFFSEITYQDNLTSYNFEKLLFWTINIDENPQMNDIYKLVFDDVSKYKYIFSIKMRHEFFKMIMK